MVDYSGRPFSFNASSILCVILWLILSGLHPISREIKMSSVMPKRWLLDHTYGCRLVARGTHLVIGGLGLLVLPSERGGGLRLTSLPVTSGKPIMPMQWGLHRKPNRRGPERLQVSKHVVVMWGWCPWRERGLRTLCTYFAIRISSVWLLLHSHQFSSVQSLSRVQLFETQGLQHARPPCPSPTPGLYSNSCPLSRWCHPNISSSVIPYSSCPQSLPASGSFPMSQLLASGGQSIGVSASASVLPVNTQDWSPLGWTGCISLKSKGLSRVFSNTTVQKHQFFGTQLKLLI